MNKRQYSREKAYIVISIVLILLGLLGILLTMPFSISGFSTSREVANLLESHTASNSTSANKLSDDMIALSDTNLVNSQSALSQIQEDIDSTTDINSEVKNYLISSIAQVNEQLAQVKTQTSEIGNNFRVLTQDNTAINTELVSSLKRASDNASNVLFLTGAAILFIVLGVVLQFTTRKNFGRLAEDLISLIEKHRQLLSVKKLLEVERDQALDTIANLEADMTKLELKHSKLQKRALMLEAELQDSQGKIKKLENDVEKLRRK